MRSFQLFGRSSGAESRFCNIYIKLRVELSLLEKTILPRSADLGEYEAVPIRRPEPFAAVSATIPKENFDKWSWPPCS